MKVKFAGNEAKVPDLLMRSCLQKEAIAVRKMFQQTRLSLPAITRWSTLD